MMFDIREDLSPVTDYGGGLSLTTSEGWMLLLIVTASWERNLWKNDGSDVSDIEWDAIEETLGNIVDKILLAS